MTVNATQLQDAVRPGCRIGHRIEVHAVIGSTNDRAAELLDGGEEGVAVVAELQTSGRGRRGRTWASPPGVNLTMSVGLRARLPATDAWRLALATALAARGACEPIAPLRLKWPNDLVDGDDHKVGGLLVETTIDGDRLRSAVVGIGINVNWRRSEMPPGLAAGATSLAELSGAVVDRAALLGGLLAALEAEVEGIEAGASPLDRYRAVCSTIGRRVTVQSSDGLLSGIAVGLDATAALVVETIDGTVSVSAGEVTRVHPADRR